MKGIAMKFKLLFAPLGMVLISVPFVSLMNSCSALGTNKATELGLDLNLENTKDPIKYGNLNNNVSIKKLFYGVKDQNYILFVGSILDNPKETEELWKGQCPINKTLVDFFYSTYEDKPTKLNVADIQISPNSPFIQGIKASTYLEDYDNGDVKFYSYISDYATIDFDAEFTSIPTSPVYKWTISDEKDAGWFFESDSQAYYSKHNPEQYTHESKEFIDKDYTKLAGGKPDVNGQDVWNWINGHKAGEYARWDAEALAYRDMLKDMHLLNPNITEDTTNFVGVAFKGGVFQQVITADSFANENLFATKLDAIYKDPDSQNG
ncbi:MAG: hypothetical protein LBC44_03890 [Mycoplasmataceae bacterium]|nr:hypothetical protein [Mycoplasmataceae bacterium]